jgi:hypothetical protein
LTGGPWSGTAFFKVLPALRITGLPTVKSALAISGTVTSLGRNGGCQQSQRSKGKEQFLHQVSPFGNSGEIAASQALAYS